MWILIRFFFNPKINEMKTIFCLRVRGENCYSKLL